MKNLIQGGAIFMYESFTEFEQVFIMNNFTKNFANYLGGAILSDT